MSSPASRLISLIMLLQSKPNQKARELAEKLGVSVRTLHRYFELLEEMGIPIYSERGPQGGFSLVRGYKMPPLVFSPEEGVALYLGTTLVGEVWGRLYQEAAAGAQVKLDNAMPQAQMEEVAWARRSLAVSGLHRTDPLKLSPYLEKIRKAARQQQRIKIRYQGSTTRQDTIRLVDPYAMAFRSGWSYLVGYCHLRQGMRTFRVDRILELELLDFRFQKPAEFEIQTYLDSEFKDLPGVRGRLRFEAEAAYIATSNLATWEEMRRNADGSVEAVLAAPDLNWLASMVLGFGGWAKVLEPPELVTLVHEWAKRITTLHEVRPGEHLAEEVMGEPVDQRDSPRKDL